jgi:hypothetical protein
MLSINKNWLSTISDNNIWHILIFDIIPNYGRYKNIFISENNINKDSKPQIWRNFVLKKIYPESKIFYIKTNPEQKKSEDYSFNHYDFIKYNKNEKFKKIISKINSNKEREYILLNQRRYDDRYLYENNTGLPLHDFFKDKKIKIKFKHCCFDEMTIEQQFDICSKAYLLISTHGAGCTNLIFTPMECPLLEVNQRTHWNCDPVCDDHFNGKLLIEEKCNGKLKNKKHYHKADFHNFCHLIDKKYYEISPKKYFGINNRNPINKKKIYIDGQECLNIINNL